MKKLASKILISIWLMSMFFSCSTEKTKTSEPDLYQEVLNCSNDYFNAVRSENADLVVSFWADDLRIVSGQQDILGEDALRQFLEVFYKSSTVIDVSILGREIEASDSLAVEIVEYSEIVSSNDNERRTIQGKQIQIWKKRNDKWEISRMACIPASPARVPSQ